MLTPQHFFGPMIAQRPAARLRASNADATPALKSLRTLRRPIVPMAAARQRRAQGLLRARRRVLELKRGLQLLLRLQASASALWLLLLQGALVLPLVRWLRLLMLVLMLLTRTAYACADSPVYDVSACASVAAALAHLYAAAPP